MDDRDWLGVQASYVELKSRARETWASFRTGGNCLVLTGLQSSRGGTASGDIRPRPPRLAPSAPLFVPPASSRHLLPKPPLPPHHSKKRRTPPALQEACVQFHPYSPQILLRDHSRHRRRRNPHLLPHKHTAAGRPLRVPRARPHCALSASHAGHGHNEALALYADYPRCTFRVI